MKLSSLIQCHLCSLQLFIIRKCNALAFTFYLQVCSRFRGHSVRQYRRGGRPGLHPSNSRQSGPGFQIDEKIHSGHPKHWERSQARWLERFVSSFLPVNSWVSLNEDDQEIFTVFISLLSLWRSSVTNVVKCVAVVYIYRFPGRNIKQSGPLQKDLELLCHKNTAQGKMYWRHLS